MANKWRRRHKALVNRLEIRVALYDQTRQQMYDFKRERDALLAWQRRLREAWKRYDAPVGVGRCYAEEAEMLRRAIEGEPGKEE